MELLLNGGASVPPIGVDKRVVGINNPSVTNKKKENFSRQKGDLIYQLIQLAFHNDGGVSKLSYDSIAEQIQAKLEATGITHDDISPYNIRNWIGRLRDK